MLSVLFFWGCSTSPDEEPAPVKEEPVENSEQESPLPETEPEPEIVVAPDPPDPVPEEEPAVEEPTDQIEPAEESFVVTEEVFAKTFEDVEELIKRLNSIIDKENYEEWTENLTGDYKTHYSSADVLKEISERPILKKYNLRLTTLKDYFRYVVVPSRANARLDDLVFEDNNHVKAIMIIDGQRVILYQLELIADEWKIGI